MRKIKTKQLKVNEKIINLVTGLLHSYSSSFTKNPVQHIVFLLVLFIGIAVRFQFFREFPYAFGHPDSSEYLRSLLGLIQGKPYVPVLLHVNGTYVYFMYFVLKVFGQSSLNIVLFQSILAIIAAVLGFFIIKKLTSSFFLANIGFLLIILLPRGLFYEHILLSDSIFATLIMFFAFFGLLFYEKPNLKLSFILGLLSSFLVLGRGQGLIAPFLSILLFIIVALQRSIGLKRFLILVTVFSLPLVILIGSYLQTNVKYNHFHGLSASSNYNLFWVATSRFIDFDSVKYKKIKDSLKPFVVKTNKNYDGDESWGVQYLNSSGRPLAGIDFYTNDWQEIDKIMGEIAVESIQTHPLAFIYRTYWNTGDFFWGKTSLYKTIDISPLLLSSNQTVISIDKTKALNTKSFNILDGNKSTSGGAFQSLPKSVKHTSNDSKIDRFLNMFAFLTNFRLITFGIYFSMTVFVINKFKNKLFLLFLTFLLIGQVILTTVPVNSLYDRYFIPVENISIVIILCGISIFLKLSIFDKLKSILLVVLLPIFMGTMMFLFNLIPIKYPLLDKPIIGLPVSISASHQQFVVSVTLAALTTLIGVLAYQKLSDHLKEKYEKFFPKLSVISWLPFDYRISKEGK
jgi:4-amino-4-deoxy-L-arabinose transferase-like glycosyltransferase